MPKPNINIQDGFLFQHLKAAATVRLELLNGREVVGRIRRFDRFALVVEIDERETLIYKHAVASIEEVGD